LLEISFQGGSPYQKDTVNFAEPQILHTQLKKLLVAIIAFKITFGNGQYRAVMGSLGQ
jgi:hypothetical protein